MLAELKFLSSLAAALSGLFAERKVEKRYRARVAGECAAQPSPLRIAEPVDGKSAVSGFSLVRVDGEHSELDVRIETGRKHQVRRHLAQLDFPIVGDRLYGSREHDGVDLQLIAYLLALACPVAGEQVEYRL